MNERDEYIRGECTISKADFFLEDVTTTSVLMRPTACRRI